MDNIKMWKDGERLIIVIENCNLSTEKLILDMVGSCIENADIGLEHCTEEIKPILKMPVYVDKNCNQQGCYLYVPEGKLYLDNIRGLPDEADIIIKALRETTSKYEKSIQAFQHRLKDLMQNIISTVDLSEACIRYRSYIEGILNPLFCENMCSSLEEYIGKFTEEELREIILKRI